MSRVISNNNVQKVNYIKAPSATSLLATACGAAITGVAASTINKLLQEGVKLSTSKIKERKPSSIKSTHACHEELASIFTKNFKSESSSVKAVTNYKTAFINSLCCSSYQIENKKIVEENLKEVLYSSSIKEVKKKADNLILNIEQQHINILKNELTAKIKEASCQIGFSNIKNIQSTASCAIFTCENNAGQALVHEMHIDQKTNQLNHIYEYVDNKDNTCESENGMCEITVNKFQKALKNKGVSFSNSEKKPTGGNAVLPFSKEIKKQLAQERRNIAIQRVRKLNKQKNINRV